MKTRSVKSDEAAIFGSILERIRTTVERAEAVRSAMREDRMKVKNAGGWRYGGERENFSSKDR